MELLQTNRFAKAVKKLHRNQKNDLIRVYKFKMQNQLTLLAYLLSQEQITLLALGSHENFYQDLKQNH